MTPEQRLADAKVIKCAAFCRYQEAFKERDEAFFEWQTAVNEYNMAERALRRKTDDT